MLKFPLLPRPAPPLFPTCRAGAEAGLQAIRYLPVFARTVGSPSFRVLHVCLYCRLFVLPRVARIARIAGCVLPLRVLPVLQAVRPSTLHPFALWKVLIFLCAFYLHCRPSTLHPFALWQAVSFLSLFTCTVSRPFLRTSLIFICAARRDRADAGEGIFRWREGSCRAPDPIILSFAACFICLLFLSCCVSPFYYDETFSTILYHLDFSRLTRYLWLSGCLYV